MTATTRTGHPFNICERTRQKLTREAAMRTLKKMQENMTCHDYSLHVITISSILSGRWGEKWIDKSIFSQKKKKSQLKQITL